MLIDSDSGEMSIDTGYFNCVLLVKDFNAEGITINEELTSNADVPYLATRKLIPNAANPFTGKRLSTQKEQNTEPEILYSIERDIQINNGFAFLPGDWFTVKGNQYKLENWQYLGYH